MYIYIYIHLCLYLQEMSGCEWWVQVKEIDDEGDSNNDMSRDDDDINIIDNDNKNNDNDNNDDDSKKVNDNDMNDKNDGNKNDNNNKDDNDDNIDNKNNDKINKGSIGLHYDKDEVIAEIFQVGIFPQISTVTYLSSFKSIPTVIIDNIISNPIGMPIQKAYISYPSRGKHVAFDGRYLHGAIDINNDKNDDNNDDLDDNNISINDNEKKQGDEKNIKMKKNNQKISRFRVTFLVNIWINHHPAGIFNLSDNLCDILIHKENEMKEIKIKYEIFENLSKIEQNNNEGIEITEMIDENNEPFRYDNLFNCKIGKNDDSVIVNDKISNVNVTNKIINNEKNGNWLNIPFVTDNTDWGKGDDEKDLLLQIWIPSQKYLSTLISKTIKNNEKKMNVKKLLKKNNQQKDSDINPLSGYPDTWIDNDNSTLEMSYTEEDTYAYLIHENYEDDDENDNESDDENNDRDNHENL
jgi:hypothetical protein